MRRIIILTLAASIAAAALAPSAPARTKPRKPPSDPFYAEQWNLAAVQARAAWRSTKGKGALIAIVDSGVDLRHPDLRNNVVSRGADFVDPEGSDGAQDRHGHGTHVAGIAAAVADNKLGVAGVAPAADILPVRVLDEGNSGNNEAIADGIRYAARRDADVINLSLNAPAGAGEALALLADPVGEAIEWAWRKGSVVVVAAGNSAFPLCQEPASSPHALCVGAVDPEGNSIAWSRDATMTSAFVVAPGGDPLQVGSRADCTRGIISTWARGLEPASACSVSEAGYHRASGTSMATPIVSGVAALLASQGFDNEEIVDRIVSTTTDLGSPGRDPIFGYGLVNAKAALRKA